MVLVRWPITLTSNSNSQIKFKLSHQIQTLTSNSNSHIKFKFSHQIQTLTSNSNSHIKFKLSHQIQTLTSNSNSHIKFKLSPWAVGDCCVSLKMLKSPFKEIYSFKLTMLWLSLSSSLSLPKYFNQYVPGGTPIVA